MSLHSLLIPAVVSALQFSSQPSGTNADLRGLCVVSDQVAWASGTHGTVLRTTDAGAHWQTFTVPGAQSLDFRDIEAFDSDTAYLMSVGDGANSRIYKTEDGGLTWRLLFTNPDAKGFFDAIAFWDSGHGILVGDPVDGHFVIFTTSDAGATWQRQQTPPSLPDEGAFAASGTCLVVRGRNKVWFATGGPSAARVFRSTDRGHSWQVSNTQLGGGKSAGIFSVIFFGDQLGVAVGGDYQQPDSITKTLALTHDDGRSWTTPSGVNLPYRSAVVSLSPTMLLAVGTSGADVSQDSGATWQRISDSNLNAAAASKNAIWAVGPKGLVLHLQRVGQE